MSRGSAVREGAEENRARAGMLFMCCVLTATTARHECTAAATAGATTARGSSLTGLGGLRRVLARDEGTTAAARHEAAATTTRSTARLERRAVLGISLAAAAELIERDHLLGLRLLGRAGRLLDRGGLLADESLHLLELRLIGHDLADLASDVIIDDAALGDVLVVGEGRVLRLD